LTSNFWETIDDKDLGELFVLKNNLLVIDSRETVEAAMSLLEQHQYLSLPVLLTKELIGVVDCLDITCFMADKKDVESVLNTPVDQIINYSKKDPFTPLYKSGPFSALVHILSSGVHRCPVVDNKGNYVGVISQLDVLTFLAEECGDLDTHLGPLAKQTLSEMDMVNTVYSLPDTATILECLELIAKHKISAIPLVSDGKVVVGTFSISDVKKIRKQSDLQLPAKEFLNVPLAWPVTTDTRTTFVNIIKTLNSEFLHRIWIVNEKNEPIGVVGLTDVIRQISKLYKLDTHSSF